MKYKIILVIISSLAFLNSCKKVESTPNIPTSVGDVVFHIHSYLDTVEIDEYQTEYQLHKDMSIKFDTLLLKIQGIKLVLLDNNVVDFPLVDLVKTLEEESYLLGSSKLGNYKSLLFDYNLEMKATLNDTFSFYFKSDTLTKVVMEDLDFTVLPNIQNYIHLKANYKDLIEAILDSKNNSNTVIISLLSKIVTHYEHVN
jgi:hypothetical protein